MSSVKRLERLSGWLTQTSDLNLEDVNISVEFGEVKADFNEQQTFEANKDTGETTYQSAKVIDNYLMTDIYQISLVIRNQRYDGFQKLKRDLLLWLSKENQTASMTYDVEQNNQDTHDFFFDLKIEEQSHNNCGCIETC